MTPSEDGRPRPPHRTERLLSLLLPSAMSDSILRDLADRYAAEVRTRGRRAARWWYLRQTLATLNPLVLWRLRRMAAEASDPGNARTGWLRGILGDLRHGIRRIRRRPGPAAAAVVVLAIGIGGATGVYGLFAAIQDLADPGVREPETLRIVATEDSVARLRSELPAEAVPAVRGAVPRGVDHSVSRSLQMVLRRGEAVSRRAVGAVTPNHFELLGVVTARGRDLLPDDVGAGVVVLSHAYWEGRLGGDPDVVGSTVHLDREPYTVIGVAEEGFKGLGVEAAWIPLDPGSLPSDAEVLVTLRIPPDRPEVEAAIAGRLASIQEAGTELPGSRRLRLARLSELNSADRRAATTFFLLVGGLSALVLLAAIANVANLGSARVLERRRELALRLSLGASRWRVSRLVLSEHVVLGIVAAAAAVTVVFGITRLVPAWLPPASDAPFEFDVRLSHLWVAGLLALVAAVLSAWIPALQAPSNDAVLRSSREGAAGAGPGRSQELLVVAQVALSVALLVIATLLVRSTANLQGLDQGVVVANTSVFTVELPPAEPDEEPHAVIERLVERVGALPGVTAAAAAAPTPIIGRGWVDVRRPSDEVGRRARRLYVTDGYFEAVGTTLSGGMPPRSPGEVAVSRDLVELLWPDGRPIGRRIRIGEEDARVVGVVEAGSYGADRLQPHVFSSASELAGGVVTLLLRGGGGPVALFPLVRSSVAEIDPHLPVETFGSLSDLLDRVQVTRRAMAGLAGILGALALVIGLVGIYAHFSHFVSGRRRAIGVRMALGADRIRVLTTVLREGLVLALVGVVVGSALAALVATALRSFLFGVEATEPAVFVAVVATLLGTATLALLVPARRASAVDPMRILRHE